MTGGLDSLGRGRRPTSRPRDEAKAQEKVAQVTHGLGGCHADAKLLLVPHETPVEGTLCRNKGTKYRGTIFSHL